LPLHCKKLGLDIVLGHGHLLAVHMRPSDKRCQRGRPQAAAFQLTACIGCSHCLKGLIAKCHRTPEYHDAKFR
jgi:hypothetical protein